MLEVCRRIFFRTSLSPVVTERLLNDIEDRGKVECGLTGISDLRSNSRDDRMESFVLSETLKVCLLFGFW